ncbi:MAG TPA: branched-chain amino acid ABC transporter permease [Mycobacteriales bacterium]|nr:branched-chain amino acid ABC transporter permease [Mycobacteriales bacterium]
MRRARLMAQVLVLGLISGGIYALFALGVVLVHRGTGVLTFGNGEVGTAGLFLAAVLVTDRGVPWFVGAIAAIAFAIALACLFEVLVVRRMSGSDPVAIAVATVGLALFILASEFQIFGESPKALAGPVEGGVEIAGIIVTPTQIIGLVLAVVIGFGLQSLLRRTDFGLGILAAAQDPAAVRLVGVPLSRISLTIWGAAAALAVIASLLVEPTVGVFGPGYSSELYVVGLAAAVVGGLNSLPGAVVGGLTLGIAESAASRYLSDLGLSGLRYVVVLIVLLAVLLGRQFVPDLLRRLDARTTAPAEMRA